MAFQVQPFQKHYLKNVSMFNIEHIKFEYTYPSGQNTDPKI